MYTLMKSEQSYRGEASTRSRADEQKTVARYPLLDDALAACDKANWELGAPHYLINDAGKEYYAGTWID